MGRPRTPVIDGKMICSHCKIDLPIEMFNIKSYKRTCICRDCRTKYEHDLRNKPHNKEKQSEQRRIYISKNPEKFKKQSKERWHKIVDKKLNDPSYAEFYSDRKHWYSVQKNYGISKEEYFTLLEQQEYKCKICKKDPKLESNTRFKRLAVDHCHVTGKVRGLLCVACNLGLGYFKENKDNLNLAITYLEETKNEVSDKE